METERADAIVLRVQPVTESSLLTTWFTREFGKLKTLAKGARRPKSPMRGRIDLFYETEISFMRSRRSDLHLLNECFLENPHLALRANVPVLTAASHVCELVDALTVVEDAHPDLFSLLAEMLTSLEKSATPAQLIWFELQAFAATGWKPVFDGETGAAKVMRSLAGASAAAASRVRLSAEQTRAAQDFLEEFRQTHLGRPLRSKLNRAV
ncbi:MAG: DNA repair protein RecO [Verrucomicrobiota bacterium]